MHTRLREFWKTHPPCTASPFGRINLETCRINTSKEVGKIQSSTMPEKYIPGMYTRVRAFWKTPPPSAASPFGRINLLIEPSQATASKLRSTHSVRVRVWIKVRVQWSASGATSKKKTNASLYIWMIYKVLLGMFFFFLWSSLLLSSSTCRRFYPQRSFWMCTTWNPGGDASWWKGTWR